MSFYLSLLSPHYKSIQVTEVITSLWSGCGEIVRCRLDDKACVIKAISVPKHINHPRISQTEFAINRKRHSYEVEFKWYQLYSAELPQQVQVVSCLNATEHEPDKVLVFRDFAADGFSNASNSRTHILHILKWLAYFHAFHFQVKPKGLWQQGSYWHLATRPDEYNKMPDSAIKDNAAVLDKMLQTCPYKTLIHGDAKIANFAINNESLDVVGYDFQYIGAGVGVVDVMYFLGSCLNEQQLQQCADDYLAEYFKFFARAMQAFNKCSHTDVVISEWQKLWPVAWADFYRFLGGWNATHVKINAYMLKQFQTAMHKL